MAIPACGPISLTTVQTEFGGSNPIGLNEYYAGGAYVAAGTTGTYGAVPSSGAISLRNFYGTNAVVIGQQAYTTPGTFTWVAPSGVTSVSVVAVGGGGWPTVGCGCCGIRAGGGGALAYINNFTVTPGASYTVVVGAGGNYGCSGSRNGGVSYFNAGGATVTAQGAGGSSGCTGRIGGAWTAGTGGGNGGNGKYSFCTGNGGGGAGGYAGNGGAGGGLAPAPGAGSGGAGGGGAYGGGGGGVGILGQGSNGTAGNSCLSAGTSGGGGGSGGANGQNAVNLGFAYAGGYGGAYGGGAGQFGSRRGAYGGSGAVRIIWPGTTRQFPSTNTGNL